MLNLHDDENDELYQNGEGNQNQNQLIHNFNDLTFNLTAFILTAFHFHFN